MPNPLILKIFLIISVLSVPLFAEESSVDQDSYITTITDPNSSEVLSTFKTTFLPHYANRVGEEGGWFTSYWFPIGSNRVDPPQPGTLSVLFLIDEVTKETPNYLRGTIPFICSKKKEYRQERNFSSSAPKFIEEIGLYLKPLKVSYGIQSQINSHLNENKGVNLIPEDTISYQCGTLKANCSILTFILCIEYGERIEVYGLYSTWEMMKFSLKFMRGIQNPSEEQILSHFCLVGSKVCAEMINKSTFY